MPSRDIPVMAAVRRGEAAEVRELVMVLDAMTRAAG